MRNENTAITYSIWGIKKEMYTLKICVTGCNSGKGKNTAGERLLCKINIQGVITVFSAEFRAGRF
jgi:2-phosphoglycerate kinase